jgi:transposase
VQEKHVGNWWVMAQQQIFEMLEVDETLAHEHIRRICWNGGQISCPKCRGSKIYHLSEQRYRCPHCTYTFHDFSRRWINVGGLSSSQWVSLSGYFASELTANQMARAMNISYNTAYKAMTTLRLAILAQALDSRQFMGRDAEIDLGVEYVPAPRYQPSNKVPVFGILERLGLVFVDLIPGLQGETLFHFHINFHLRMARMGKLVYTDRYKQYDTIIACGDDSLPYRILQGRKEPPSIDSGKHGFWNFAKKKLQRYSGITPRRFPLYIKELEFRYNHRNEDIRPLLLESLCCFVPNHA